MSEEQENKDLQSSSSLDSGESFEQKMARIKSILAGQQVEIESRRGDEEEAFPPFDEEMSEPAAEFLTEGAEGTQEAEPFEEPFEVHDNYFQEALPEPTEEQGLVSQPMEDSSFEQEATEQAFNSVSAETLVTPGIQDKKVLSEIISDETKYKNGEKKKGKIVPIILALLILFLALIGIYAATQRFGGTAKPESSSSVESSAEPSESSEASSSESEASSSSSEPSASESEAPKSREELVASMGDSPLAPLDASLTGNEPEFTWPAGLEESFISQMVETGQIKEDEYELVPAQIAGGQGWVNLYNGEDKFVASINLVTGYVLQ